MSWAGFVASVAVVLLAVISFTLERIERRLREISANIENLNQ